MELTENVKNKTPEGVDNTRVFVLFAACTNKRFETEEKININIHPDDIKDDDETIVKDNSSKNNLTNNTHVMPAFFNKLGSTDPVTGAGAGSGVGVAVTDGDTEPHIPGV